MIPALVELDVATAVARGIERLLGMATIEGSPQTG